MEAGRHHDAAGIVALALAFHRTPTQHPDLLHGWTPLPPGVDTLLKLAGGSEPEPAWSALARPEDLKTAALFFIEQVLFRHDGNHYRVLGLEPGAATELIKEHHRLLMRVFHPDRENRADDWKDAFATRINLAYTALRDPDARHRYDATLRPASRNGTAAAAVRRTATHPKAAPPRARTAGLPPFLMRYLPQWVLASTALIAVVVVGAVYVSNPPAPAAQALPAARLDVPVRPEKVRDAAVAETRKAPADHPAAPAADMRDAPAPRTALPPTVHPAKHPSPAATLPPRVGKPSQPEQPFAAAAPSAQPAPALPSVPPQPTAVQPLKLAASMASPPTQVLHSVPQEPRTTAPAARPAEAAPPPPDPDATLARFVSSYERGDTQAFMALFDEVALGRAGGKPQIRREHESLFRSTDLRHIDIDGMAWSRDGDWIRGEGRYRTTLMKKGELRLQTETGVIRIELLRRGEQALLIMGLDYLPGGRT